MTRESSNARRLIQIAVGCLLGGLGQVAWTDSAAPAGLAGTSAGESTLEEVVVTAEKRAESEQSVPLSMTTFSAASLEQKSVESFFDYGTKVPNLAFAPTGDGVGTARTISIRGISGDGVTSFYIDDTPLPDSVDPRVLDIDHIEVLRGPQGTLYGARSMGGTVRLITRAADLDNTSGEVHAGISGTARTNRPNYTADGIVNLPLIPGRVAARLSGFFDDQAGYFTRSYCSNPATAGVNCFPLSTSGITRVNGVGAVRSYGGALSLNIKASDDVTVTPRFMAQRETYTGFPMADVLTVPGNGYGYPVPSDAYTLPPLHPTDFNQGRLFNIPEGGYDAWYLASLGVHWNLPYGELISSTGYFDRRVSETEDESDFVWAAVIGGPGAAPPFAVPGYAPISEVKHYQRLAQEVRFVSNLQGNFQFVVGGYYANLHGQIPYAAYYPPATATGLDGLTTGGVPNNGLGIANLVFAQDFNTTVQEPALFGEFSYKFNEAWKVTAGLRGYTIRTTSAGYEAGLAVGGGPIFSPSASLTQSGVNPKLEADYHVDKDHMVYGLASRGFRPGGVVPLVPPGTPNTGTDCVKALAQQDPGVSLAQTRSFNADSLWNYELGTKTSWLDHRVTVNAAIFDIRWKNIQQAVLLSCGFQFIANAGAGESKGGEFELHAAPVRDLDVSLGVGHQQAQITEVGVTSPQPVGSPIYQVPNWTGNGSISYAFRLAAGWKLITGADYAYVGRSYSGNNNASDPRERPSYRLLNGELRLVNGPLDIALVGKNLTNEAANLGDSRSIAAEVPGRPRLFVNQPRTIGVEVREHF